MSFTEGQMRRGLAVALLLVLLGGWAVVLRADDRLDPILSPPVASSTTTTVPGFEPPGEPGRVLLEGFSEMAITVHTEDGDGHALFWCLLAALTAEQRGRGLMEVTDLHGYSGMVFVYDEDTSNAYYMRDTPTALTIAWIAADGHVVTITDMAPCEDRDGCPTYPPDGSYRYAIEVPQGDLPALGITEGATVAVGGPCAPA